MERVIEYTSLFNSQELVKYGVLQFSTYNLFPHFKPLLCNSSSSKVNLNRRFNMTLNKMSWKTYEVVFFIFPFIQKKTDKRKSKVYLNLKYRTERNGREDAQATVCSCSNYYNCALCLHCSLRNSYRQPTLILSKVIVHTTSTINDSIHGYRQGS